LVAALARLQCASLSQLTARLEHDADTFWPLLQFLTVPVSELFRDATYFAQLRREIAPVLRTYPFLRLWVAGCSTGEEAYSLAILLAEEGLLDRSLIYATDINPESLRVAERGVYPRSRLAAFERNHRHSGANGPRAVGRRLRAALPRARRERSLAGSGRAGRSEQPGAGA
jgi:chemotaxis protein methyltransferase CheR